MKVSVVVPYYNEELYIEKCIKSLLNQNYPFLELIFVNDGSTDKSRQIVKKYPVINLDLNHNGGYIGKVRNAGMKIATGEILCTTDADCIVPHNWIELIVKAFKEETVSGVCGKIVSIEKDIISQIFILLHNFTLHLSYIFGINGACAANMAIRKDVFYKINGFKEEVFISEDTSLFINAGKYGRTVYIKNIVVRTSARKAKKSFFKRLYSGLIADIKIIKEKAE